MSRKYYERDEDWLVTCPECHGEGTIGKGVSRKRKVAYFNGNWQ